MDNHQTIEYDKNLPAKIRLIDDSSERCRGEPHWHEEMQLLYVDNGKLQATVGNKSYELGAGDVLVINPSEVHSLTGENARYLSVHFSCTFVKLFYASVESRDFVLEEGTQERREMTVLMQKLLAIERDNNDEYNALVKYSLLMKMLRRLLTRGAEEKKLSVYGTKRSLESDAITVKNYIEANFRRKIMINELAELMQYDSRNITPYFKKLTGKRFTDYLQEVRTKHALEDYLTYDIPVGEAALKNGFCHYNFFSKACSKYYGASPTAIKKAKRENQGKAVSLPVGIPA